MKIHVSPDAEQLGAAAAERIADKIRKSIEEYGRARIVLSTGASQFEMFDVLVKEDLDWSRVTMFHLDEYVGLPESHPASFRRYLKERFVDRVHPGHVYYVNGEGDVRENIRILSEELTMEPIDLGVIGIGENAHIAFNDPPADFETKESYILVNLNERCKLQQVGEGWFDTTDDVPKQAISMTPYRIMQCRSIVSVVPGKRKAQAVYNTLSGVGPDPAVPATMLLTHPDFYLYLDTDSASLCTMELLSDT